MVERPIFIVTYDIKKPVEIKNIEFNWIKGISYSQKCKRRDEFHKEIQKKYDINRVLEVSTKSNKDIGIKLSAFNLKFKYKDNIKSVEEIYQSSKIIDNNSIIGFKYEDIFFENEPKGMFYDWLYISALKQNEEYLNQLEEYEVFTDIEFNPKRSYNCQARAVAIYKTLYQRRVLDEYLSDINKFKEYYKETFKGDNQLSLF